MTGASERLPVAAGILLLTLLAGCGLESTNEPPYEPGIHFHGEVQMGVARDAQGNTRPVVRITD